MVPRAPPCAGTDPALKKSRRGFFSASRAPPPPSFALLRILARRTQKNGAEFFSAPSVMLFLQLTRPARWILCRFWRATP